MVLREKGQRVRPVGDSGVLRGPPVPILHPGAAQLPPAGQRGGPRLRPPRLGQTSLSAVFLCAADADADAGGRGRVPPLDRGVVQARLRSEVGDGRPGKCYLQVLLLPAAKPSSHRMVRVVVVIIIIIIVVVVGLL